MTILVNSVEDTQRRVLNNIAYAMTGAFLLQHISGVEFENFIDLAIDYAKKEVKRYEDIQTPVEMVLSHIATL